MKNSFEFWHDLEEKYPDLPIQLAVIAAVMTVSVLIMQSAILVHLLLR